jgi:phage terminase small subunit
MRDTLLSELEEERQLALKRGQISAAVAATMGKAKLLGLIIDRREVGEVGFKERAANL